MFIHLLLTLYIMLLLLLLNGLLTLTTRVGSIITHDNCTYTTTTTTTHDNALCPFNSDVNVIKYYAKGINVTSVNPSEYDMTFFACVNKFYTCGYMLSENEAVNYDSTGVKIGYGVDLGQYSDELWRTRNMPSDALSKVQQYFQLTGNAAKQALMNNALELDYNTAYDISVTHLKYLQSHLVNTLNVGSKLNKPQITTPLLSVLLNTNETESSLGGAIRSRNVVNIGYIIENLVTNLTFIKQAQALALTALNTECHSKTLITLIVDTSKTSFNFKYMYIHALSGILLKIPFEFAFVAFGDKSDVVFDFTSNTTYMDEQVESYQYTSSNVLHATEGLIKADELFVRRLSHEHGVHYKKVMVLIVNKEVNDDVMQLNEMIMKYKYDKHYHVILITSEDVHDAYSEQILNEKHNVIYIDTLQNEIQDNDVWLPNVLYTSICRQHVQLTLGMSVNNLRINSISDVHYFEMRVMNASSRKYIITFHIDNLQDVNYNIYVSTRTPYPNVNEYDIKHLGNIYDYFYRPASQPYLVLLLPDNNNTTQYESIYISVESDNLYYNITINECNDVTTSINECNVNTSTSNGLFYHDDLTSRMGPSLNYYSFTNCYNRKCLVNSTESLMKYFARGLTSFNTDDYETEHNTYFNSNLFTCLYSLFYCVYIEDEHGALAGHPETIALRDADPFRLLLYDFFPKLLINKIRPLLLIKDTSLVKQKLTEENVYFTRDDALVLYNVTRKKYLDSMNHSLVICTSCPHVFYQLDINWRFILFMNTFENKYYTDSSLTYISNMNSNDYLKLRFNNAHEEESTDDTFVNKHIQNILIQSMNSSNSREKCLISLIVGKSLAYMSEFLNFYKYFVDSLYEQKISLTIYNEESKRLERVIDFSKPSDNTKTALEKYIHSHKQSLQHQTQFDVDYIINMEIPRFSTYDKGIKRVIVIIGDERFTTSDGTYINHNIRIITDDNNSDNVVKLNKTRNDLQNEQVNLMLITSISPDVKYKQYVDTYSSFFKFEEIYPLTNFSQLQNIAQNVVTAIRQIVIQIPPTFEIINDYYKDNLYYYEIELKQIQRKTRLLDITFNPVKKVNVYYSYLYPYPNKFANKGNCSFNTSECRIEVVDREDKEKLYLTFEPVESVVLLKVQVCEWNESKGKCDNVQEVSFVSIVLLVISGFGLFVYGIASCKYGEHHEKKKINIFN